MHHGAGLRQTQRVCHQSHQCPACSHNSNGGHYGCARGYSLHYVTLEAKVLLQHALTCHGHDAQYTPSVACCCPDMTPAIAAEAFDAQPKPLLNVPGGEEGNCRRTAQQSTAQTMCVSLCVRAKAKKTQLPAVRLPARHACIHAIVAFICHAWTANPLGDTPAASGFTTCCIGGHHQLRLRPPSFALTIAELHVCKHASSNTHTA